ncbi:2-hydroxyacyl-CoA dehydratase family protein [Sphingomonas sp. HF-S4]|uniref:2-hydroxyacyl-CoA dehydratase family protein n=1 Tax=Sphingomonas agrestis TaxID=3080540 RepID=A0ABU3Y7M2_9SPHN|nr:2-hydroxyacyl-CoA dehydratase family protein [Sphingomonas sp. HF-S4]MDV3457092.1 2-hydroxyacyl-CoA dehydratase family protein [Sphingomonas sp. HF-S4]
MIASIGPGLPQDLFAATGRYRGPVALDADRATPAADRWLESKFSAWARAVLEHWSEGAFDDLDLMVFSRTDDTAQRLYYYICELQRAGTLKGPEPFLLDIAKVQRPSSVDHTIAATRRLADRLDVNAYALEGAILATNVQRRAAIYEAGARVCLLSGSPPPDRRLHDAIEAAGFSAVGPTLSELWHDAGPLVDEATEDPVAAIGRQLHAWPDDQRGFGDKAATVIERVEATAAKAVVLWYTEEDEARVWHVPAIRAALQAAEVPARILTRRDWAARDGAPQEIRKFIEELSA